ncbi:MAG: hypothetical protein M3376_01020 [Actinomycetota bacterium]|nr:hypothetical protein [Actinomycetota bacterium]
METNIEEGRLVELPTPEATGMQRRAFGEFVGIGGELASYALGWTTGAERHVAHKTIGIGAGNAGGATFHAELFSSDDGYAFAPSTSPSNRCRRAAPTTPSTRT